MERWGEGRKEVNEEEHRVKRRKRGGRGKKGRKVKKMGR